MHMIGTVGAGDTALDAWLLVGLYVLYVVLCKYWDKVDACIVSRAPPGPCPAGAPRRSRPSAPRRPRHGRLPAGARLAQGGDDGGGERDLHLDRGPHPVRGHHRLRVGEAVVRAPQRPLGAAQQREHEAYLRRRRAIARWALALMLLRNPASARDEYCHGHCQASCQSAQRRHITLAATLRGLRAALGLALAILDEAARLGPLGRAARLGVVEQAALGARVGGSNDGLVAIREPHHTIWSERLTEARLGDALSSSLTPGANALGGA